MSPEPTLTARHEDGLEIPLLVWRLAEPLLAISSAALGGGIGVRHWVVNATVPMSYRRDDPDVHLTELAAREGLDGPGIGLLTGVDVAEVVSAEDGGVRAWATVGLGDPIWAAAPPADAPAAPGTVNIVVRVPVRLSVAALVNAAATATEAKAQALWDLGLPATGTSTDTISILCVADGPEAAYGGPRSEWGAPLARAVHAAVRKGGGTGQGSGMPWSDRLL
ncbi:adenosylcobinamide amidohydrolase [Phytohabitans houttuyneae]|uniref:Adenosylcobinamide amidohydrolase n=1 Tax=Phytohabitans houttuyneae TaxID=1076126 RepID=A0A6V8K4M8_9ACTN|nr:adenosylcobinamide amidohydrolase [Phytohabitans houttuyneae]GFJ80143.1 adenosylcobinamide amidohydrolase [Phytohabitans houttuyneae]